MRGPSPTPSTPERSTSPDLASSSGSLLRPNSGPEQSSRSGSLIRPTSEPTSRSSSSLLRPASGPEATRPSRPELDAVQARGADPASRPRADILTPSRSYPSAPVSSGPLPVARSARSGVFIAYSHRDRDLLGELQVHLKPLQKAWMLDLWDDLRVDHGPRGAAELRRAIEATRVAVLLISPGFLASPFIAEHALPVTLASQLHPRAAVMCLYLRPAMDVFAEYNFADPITGNPRSIRITNFHDLNDPTCPLAAQARPARAGILAAAAEEIIAAAHRSPPPSVSEY